MPVLFIGHGTPMNAIENNEFSDKWKELGKILPRPKAILCISAHWEKERSMVTAMEKPKTIHDFGGFPELLYRQQYPSSGSPLLAEDVRNMLPAFEIEKDFQWGLDHGTWCFLKHMYPQADIPVLQLSINHSKKMQYHYELGKQLSFLRQKEVLVVGSGNMVHNLWLARPDKNGFNTGFGYDWAYELNEKMKEAILARDHGSLIHYNNLNPKAALGIPTEEHYIPLIYTLALSSSGDNIEIFNDKIVAGSLSMTSFVIGTYT
ncbi:MAG: 4,5-DOPA dioxygenase extradiol [Tannerella sp.]|nr:4,5-DOPA dioxygenase extradiol [Tannerella sp.]